MTSIRVIEARELVDPDLIAAADRIVDTAIFSMHKAQGHLAAPATFPLPANPTSFERVAINFLREIPDDELGTAVRRPLEALRRGPLTAVSRANSAVFEGVDLESAEEIEIQLARLSPQFSRVAAARRTPVTTEEAQPMRPMSGGLPGSGVSNLRWRLRKMYCNEETGYTSIGSDHLYIGGARIDAFGNSAAVPVQDLGGGWDTGNSDWWEDRTLTSFDLDYGTGWPRPCAMILAISVRSAEGLWELIDKLVAKAKEEVIKYAATTAGAAAGFYVGAAAGSLGGPLGMLAGSAVGAIVGYVVGYVIDKLWNWLKGLFTGTKLFKPVPLTIEIPYHGSDFGGKLATDPFEVWWTGHGGKYTGTLDAVLNWGPASVLTAISQETDKLDLFRVDSKTNVQERSWGKQTNWKWTEWKHVLSGRTTCDGPISVVARNKTQLDLFMIGFDGRVWTSARESPLSDAWGPHLKPKWAGWWPVGTSHFILGTSVTGVARAEDCLDVFATGKDGKVWAAEWGPQSQHKWVGSWTVGQGQFLPGTPIAAVSRSENMIDLFAIGLDGRVWSAAKGPHTQNQWNGWFPILSHVFLPSLPVTAISRKPNQLDIFAVDGAGEVRAASWSPTSNNGQWGGWWRVTETNGKFTPGTPIAVASWDPDKLDLFAIGLDGRVWTAAWSPSANNGKWAGWWAIGDPRFSQGSMISATARRPNQLDIFVTGLDGNTWSAAWDGGWKWFTI